MIKLMILLMALFSIGNISSDINYEELWKQVEKLEKEGLTKSAAEKVEEIFNMALVEKNEPEILKSIIYRLDYINILEEDGYVKAIGKLESEIKSFDGVVKPMMHLFLGTMYYDYYDTYSYQINKRSVTSNFDNDDILTWDKEKFKEKIASNFLQAMSEELKNANIIDYANIITNANISKDEIPTLYDFAAYHVIYKLSSNDYTQNLFGKLTENAYLNDIKSFVNLAVDNLVIKIYQKWLQNRLDDENNTEALVFADLNRLNYVRANLNTVDKDNIWIETIKTLQKKYFDKPQFVLINYELALYYNSLGNEYDFQNATTLRYKSYKKEAIKFLDDAIERFPHYIKVGNCINLKNVIEKTNFTFKIENVVSSKSSFPLRISFKNIDSIYLSVLKCDYNDYLNIENIDVNDEYIEEVKKISVSIISSKLIKLPITDDYNEHYTEYLADPLDNGFYLVFLHAKPELELNENYIANSNIFVSDISVLVNNFNSGEKNGFYILDRNSGKPIEKAKVQIYATNYDYKKRKHEYTLKQTVYTDKNGYVKIKLSEDNYLNARIDISYGRDYVSLSSYLYDNMVHNEHERNVVTFFTDRAIYRPGQTVYFKGLCLKYNDEHPQIRTKAWVTVSFRGANYQEISNLKLISNEFGSIEGSFTIPLGVLSGNFVIKTEGGSKSIKVEEYKRPMFEVNTLPLKGEYKINDSVNIEGTAITYAGTALSEAKISYVVTQNPIWRYYRPYTRLEAKVIDTGETEIDEYGNFNIKFKALADEIDGTKDNIYYNYTVDISVTDMNGETQNTTTSVLVSNQALVLSENIKSVVAIETFDSISIETTNISGNFVSANVDIEIFKLKDKGLLLASREWEKIDMPLYSQQEWYDKYSGNEYDDENNFSKWEVEKKVYEQKINTEKISKLKPDGLSSWQPGIYRIVLNSKDKWGNEIKYSKEFTLFSDKSKKMPCVSTSFYSIDKFIAQPGDTITAHIGSSYKDVNLVYSLRVKGKVFETKILKLNSGIKKIEIPVKEQYRGGLTISFMFVKQGKIYEFSQNINVAWKNKELNLKLTTFRDKTLPGAVENWQIKISDSENKPVNAELLATLYDASLDAFARDTWSFSPHPYYYTHINWQILNHSIDIAAQTSKEFYKNNLYKNVYYPNPTLLFFDIYENIAYNMKSFAFHSRAVAEVAVVNEKVVIEDDEDLKSLNTRTDKKREDLSNDIPVRQNFNETAFFYPNLMTNFDGEILLGFTMPESLTRWNFMGLAHTTDLKIGQISASVVTQKELMIMPNLPRFFRENDKIIISTKINNISETLISGNAKIEFYNPENLESLNEKFLGIKHGNVKFDVEAGKNTSVKWEVVIPEGIGAVGVRIVADGKTHADGEERILPILTNKMLVTESMPLPVRKSGTTSFTMNSLKNSNSSNTLKNHSYTLEFTANPAWYAVQALPYLMEYPYECAEQTFSRFYANSLATHIANSDPKIKRIFEIWKNTPNTTVLLSNLEKNQELKSLLIEETPWLLDAKNEAERKQRIGILFDLNRMTMENISALNKLREMQKNNGGWPWFKGMAESWYITQHIVSGLGHMDNLGIYVIRKDQSAWEMTRKAITYIDYEIERLYKNLKSNCNADCLNEDHISYLQIHYLYARSFFINDFPIPEATKEAFEYYKNQAAKYWNDKNIYMQGMIALALHRTGNNVVPSKILASFKERSIHSEEMGTYWRYNSGYNWYNAPIETQALLIEAFDEISNDTTLVEDAKVWLLKQKQSQDWKTTKATAEAIYALLLQGTDLLTETDIPIIKIGNLTIDANSDSEIKTEAGTGYFKKTWDATQITPEWANVTVSKKTNSVSWGAVYWQYFEQLDKITGFEETPLKISKKLFVERRKDNSIVITPIENDAKLSVGDKIKVRIEIRSDRDMEYVHLKDMRASCFEPVDYLSGYRYKSGIGYYQSIKDASMNFFIDYLRKGTYVFEYDLIVSQKGEFSNGITTIQSMYAPEFTSHSEGVRVVVE
jgi:uncharacterized protein YfaS (alpha-2-macroglobulin family)